MKPITELYSQEELQKFMSFLWLLETNFNNIFPNYDFRFYNHLAITHDNLSEKFLDDEHYEAHYEIDELWNKLNN